MVNSPSTSSSVSGCHVPSPSCATCARYSATEARATSFMVAGYGELNLAQTRPRTTSVARARSADSRFRTAFLAMSPRYQHATGARPTGSQCHSADRRQLQACKQSITAEKYRALPAPGHRIDLAGLEPPHLKLELVIGRRI